MKWSTKKFLTLSVLWFGSTSLGLTARQQQEHVQWMLSRIGANPIACGVTPSAVPVMCARTSLPVQTVEADWDGNVHLAGLTPYPAVSYLQGWSQTQAGNPSRVYSHDDGAMYAVTLYSVPGGTELLIGYVSSGEPTAALPFDSRLAKLITPAAKQTYPLPLKPPDYVVTDLKGKVSSTITRNYKVSSAGQKTLTETNIQTFDTQGRRTSLITQDPNGEVTYRLAYEYEGRLLKRVKTEKNSNLTVDIFAYDDRGNWRERRTLDKNDQVLMITAVTAFPNGYESTVYAADGKVTYRRRVLLDERNDEVAYESEKGEAANGFSKVFENGRMAKFIMTTDDYTITQEYDPRTGEQTRTVMNSKSVGVKVDTYNCETRDKYGNCTKKVKRESPFGSTKANTVTEIVEVAYKYYSVGYKSSR